MDIINQLPKDEASLSFIKLLEHRGESLAMNQPVCLLFKIEHPTTGCRGCEYLVSCAKFVSFEHMMFVASYADVPSDVVIKAMESMIDATTKEEIDAVRNEFFSRYGKNGFIEYGN